MSKKSNVINFKKEKLKKFDEENEIIFLAFCSMSHRGKEIQKDGSEEERLHARESNQG